ncbi:39S ribosomal protein L11, mitochondrial-like [Pollicipes pollicipes]|uniref:39S ribosomal protein L11, mitochondrial-like n=1 Tax=Pollicipes pollicipes TaxID=41117 RepID=UPI00188554E4|nr:39S ribosomal protein L11, mitochondrial-like [Pollicipes pollicipes]XP_037085445.1 39S ribosomal protein L11, mitochondrial-like [Pollicipes pollicipes]XP_037085454.1 39S ribosomal protein L11, mitochondrial-like [Pollicipes pollicipes]XP_037085462.1 39S ribosomal protein L11, mitochondrial-like [Pollicipes pollicipes]
MSKVANRLKNVKKAVEKVVHGPTLRTDIKAQGAVAGPPLGPQLGQRGINIAAFCKDFNERTKDIQAGIPLPCRISVRADRSYELVIHQPPTTYFLKQAAGARRGATKAGHDVAGKVTLKHIYEIAKIKSADPPLQEVDLKEICEMVIRTARSCGIQVVRDLDPVEYGEFLAQREEEMNAQDEALAAVREAKLLRTK